MSATRTCKALGSKLIVGLKNDAPTSPQFGPATKAAITYEMNTSERSRNTLSARLYEPLTTNHQSRKATGGTASQRGMLNSSAAAAMPTNSEIVMPILEMSSTRTASMAQPT